MTMPPGVSPTALIYKVRSDEMVSKPLLTLTMMS